VTECLLLAKKRHEPTRQSHPLMGLLQTFSGEIQKNPPHVRILFFFVIPCPKPISPGRTGPNGASFRWRADRGDLCRQSNFMPALRDSAPARPHGPAYSAARNPFRPFGCMGLNCDFRILRPAPLGAWGCFTTFGFRRAGRLYSAATAGFSASRVPSSTSLRQWRYQPTKAASKSQLAQWSSGLMPAFLASASGPAFMVDRPRS